MPNPKKFYGVAKGRIPGVYSSWSKAREQVHDFYGAQLHGFESIGEAKSYVTEQGNIDHTQVAVFQSHFDQFRGIEAKMTGIKFEPDENKPFLDQFNALASAQNWKPNSQEYRAQRNEAMKEEFELKYLSLEGKRLNGDQRMEGYRKLCKALGKAEPQSIQDGQAILKAKPWVNIINLIDAQRTGAKTRTFDNAQDFVLYTKISRKWIDLEYAKKHEFLRALLVDFRQMEKTNYIPGGWRENFDRESLEVKTFKEESSEEESIEGESVEEKSVEEQNIKRESAEREATPPQAPESRRGGTLKRRRSISNESVVDAPHSKRTLRHCSGSADTASVAKPEPPASPVEDPCHRQPTPPGPVGPADDQYEVSELRGRRGQ